MQVLEARPDFSRCRIAAKIGSFVRGFGLAYALGGGGLDRPKHLDSRK
jgi:hypothetical protein